MNTQTLIDAITNTLEEADWNVSPYKDPRGIGLEVETWTDGTNYDYIGLIDMRGKDTTDPDAWIREANECYEAFDPEEEALLWVRGKGAPSLREMLDDFDDFKTNRLAPTPQARGGGRQPVPRGGRAMTRLDHNSDAETAFAALTETTGDDLLASDRMADDMRHFATTQ